MAAGWVNRPAATVLAVSAYLTGASCRACFLRQAAATVLHLRALILLRSGRMDLRVLNRIVICKETKVVRVTTTLLVEWNFMARKTWDLAGRTVSVWIR